MKAQKEPPTMDNTNPEVLTDQNVEQFAADITEGLNADPKKLPSKYFYNAKGDKLFQEIMKLEEYYLTRAEYEVLDTYKNEILEITAGSGALSLFELGAGDGYKTKILLRHFHEQEVDLTYFPIDISGNVLEQLATSLATEIPTLQVEPLEGDYFKMLENISGNTEGSRLVLFLGSNIGNFTGSQAGDFLKLLRNSLSPGDYFMLGVDLKKDPEVILKAYNDSKGVTAEFNLNLLDRINRQLDADFNRDRFIHRPHYDPVSGECRSYLISTEAQDVHIAHTGETVSFDRWEPIHMEVSKKYAQKELEVLATECGFELVKHFTDERGYFVDSLWRVK